MPKKKSRGGLNVFQFAQTVEHDAWQDDQQRMALRVRPATSVISVFTDIMCRSQQEEISRIAKANSTSRDVPTTTPETKPPPSITRTRSDTFNCQRYTIVQHEETSQARFLTSPYVACISSFLLEFGCRLDTSEDLK